MAAARGVKRRRLSAELTEITEEAAAERAIAFDQTTLVVQAPGLLRGRRRARRLHHNEPKGDRPARGGSRWPGAIWFA